MGAVALRYYKRLVKEFVIADLDQYKINRFGFRWRTESEVTSGKGQFICGAQGCSKIENLLNYRVHFRYQEAGESKDTYVKARLCDTCGVKLNHKKLKLQAKKRKKDMKKKAKEERRRSRDRRRSREQRRRSISQSDSDSDSEVEDEEEGSKRSSISEGRQKEEENRPVDSLT